MATSRRRPAASGIACARRRQPDGCRSSVAGAEWAVGDRGLGPGGRRRAAAILVIGGEAGHRQVAPGRRARGVDVGSRGARVGRTRAYAAEGRLSYAPVAALAAQPRAGPGPAPSRRGSLVRDLAAAAGAADPAPGPARGPRRGSRTGSARRSSASLVERVRRGRPAPAPASSTTSSGATRTPSSGSTSSCAPIAVRRCWSSARSGRTRSTTPTPSGGSIAGLRDEGRLTEIALGPLEPAETSALAAQVAGRSLTPEQADDLQRETEGNPLFVVETVRAGLVQPVRVRAIEAADDGIRQCRDRSRAIAPKVQQVIAGAPGAAVRARAGRRLGRRRPSAGRSRSTSWTARAALAEDVGRRRARRAAPTRTSSASRAAALRLRARQDPRGRVRGR